MNRVDLTGVFGVSAKRLGLDTDPAARRPQDQHIVLLNRGALLSPQEEGAPLS